MNEESKTYTKIKIEGDQHFINYDMNMPRLDKVKYVSYKDLKAVTSDLKKIYTAKTEEMALFELKQFSAIWYTQLQTGWKPVGWKVNCL